MSRPSPSHLDASVEVRVTLPAGRLSPVPPDYLTEVTGPWTSEAVETMIALGAVPETDYDRLTRGLIIPHAYEAWVWDQPVNGYLLHVLGYEEPNDLGWRFVLDLSVQGSRRLVLPTLTLRDRAFMAEKASAMLNYALTLPARSATTSATPSRTGGD